MARTRNTKLTAVIRELGWSQEQVANRFVSAAAEMGAVELLATQRSHVSMWVLGTQPTGRAPGILCETLSRGLKRPLSLPEIGLTEPSPDTPEALGWHVDTLTALSDLGRTDLNVGRRQFLASSVYSVAGLALPDEPWWQKAAERGRTRISPAGRSIGNSDVDAVREVVSFFQRRDQRHGGGHGRSAVVAYLTDEVADSLSRAFPNEQVRQDLFSAAAELAYLIGWMAFDASQHAVGQRYFTLAVKLSAEANDPALAAHILRAMAHQALDLGHHRQALDLAAASMDRTRYARATSRERALLGVVYARSLAAVGQKKDAAAALLQAEGDLSATALGIEEPDRVFFFSEASLAHETACALRDVGDLKGAQREFTRSVRTRKAATFARTHAVTLGYLGAVQAQQGEIEAACATWSHALDTMDGLQSGRVSDTVVNMRRVISPFHNRGIGAVAEVDTRAASILRTVA